MENIKLVIFDLDGTLVDAYAAISKSFNFTMRQLGEPVKRALVIRRAVGWGDKNLLKGFVKPSDLNRALAIYRRHHKSALLKGSRLLPVVRRTLNYLRKKGYKLAIASNRPTYFSQLIIRSLRIKEDFDYVLCADKLRQGKPNPQILKRIMKKLRVSAEETVYVGDMGLDAATAKAAKMKSIIVATGSSSISDIKIERPFLIIKNISKLEKVL